MSQNDRATQNNVEHLDTGLAAGRIAFVQANWHKDIVGQGREAFLESFEAQGGARDRVDIFDVPIRHQEKLEADIAGNQRIDY